jgi:hypothetical protein
MVIRKRINFLLIIKLDESITLLTSDSWKWIRISRNPEIQMNKIFSQGLFGVCKSSSHLQTELEHHG